MNSIKNFILKYKTQILLGIIIVLVSTIMLPTCKKKYDQIYHSPYQKTVDSLDLILEQNKMLKDSINNLIKEKQLEVKGRQAKITKTDKSRLKKDEEIIRKNIANDTISVDGILKYWSNELK